MAIYVISDLHLSFSTNKPMDVFGEKWEQHHEKIKEDWLSKVKEDDLVILPGDFSWALNFDQADSDFEWLKSLPGRKILVKGNHDYWWNSMSKMTKRYPYVEFLHNNFLVHDGVAICGTRGWLCPNDSVFDEHDQKIYKREVMRLEMSLKEAEKAGHKDIIGVLHYPPTNDSIEASDFTVLFEDHCVKEVVYGHLHTEHAFGGGIKGDVNGVKYHLTSCDYLEFQLLKLRD